MKNRWTSLAIPEMLYTENGKYIHIIIDKPSVVKHMRKHELLRTAYESVNRIANL